jgi:phosphotriesterase-related protein
VSNSTVNTVTGPVEGSRLGVTDSHEHVFLRSPYLPGDEFEDLDRMSDEVSAVAATGVQTIVDLTPIGLGRAPERTRQLSERTGVNVVLASGIHRTAHYPAGHWVYDLTEAELKELFLKDLLEGIDDRDWRTPYRRPTAVRAGIVKLGVSYQHFRATERAWLAVGAQAAQEARVPVAVHLEIGTMAHEVLDLFETEGLPPAQVMLAHLDRNPDIELHAELAARGAFLAYDSVGKVKYHSDAAILDSIESMAARGQTANLLLGTDVGRSSSLRAYGGGPGMDVLGRVFLPRLRARLGQETESAIMVDNPRDLLTLARV